MHKYRLEIKGKLVPLVSVKVLVERAVIYKSLSFLEKKLIKAGLTSRFVERGMES